MSSRRWGGRAGVGFVRISGLALGFVAGCAGSREPGETHPGTLEPIVPPGFNVVEDLDRGVVAVAEPEGVYVGWRMLGYEYDRANPERTTYDLYRDGKRI